MDAEFLFQDWDIPLRIPFCLRSFDGHAMPSFKRLEFATLVGLKHYLFDTKEHGCWAY